METLEEMETFTIKEENLQLHCDVQDKEKHNEVDKIDELSNYHIFDSSNQIAKAGLERMNSASSREKLRAFIKGAKDKYNEMIIEGGKLVEIHIVVGKVFRDAMPKEKRYIIYYYFHKIEKVYIVLCLAWVLDCDIDIV